MNDHQGMCQKCKNRKSCKTPCAFVEAILTEGNRIYEKAGQSDITVYPKWNEVQESVLRQKIEEDCNFMNENNHIDAELFSTEDAMPWLHSNYGLERTKVFIMRVFEKRSWADIAMTLNTDADRVYHLFRDSTDRLIEALAVLDKRRAVIDDVKVRLAISEKASGSMPKMHKWFLLNKVFGLLPREIAEMDGADVKTVCGRIKDVADKVMAGQLTFMDPTPEQIEAAKARIEQKRARDRKGRQRDRRAA